MVNAFFSPLFSCRRSPHSPISWGEKETGGVVGLSSRQVSVGWGLEGRVAGWDGGRREGMCLHRIAPTHTPIKSIRIVRDGKKDRKSL